MKPEPCSGNGHMPSRSAEFINVCPDLWGVSTSRSPSILRCKSVAMIVAELPLWILSVIFEIGALYHDSTLEMPAGSGAKQWHQWSVIYTTESWSHFSEEDGPYACCFDYMSCILHFGDILPGLEAPIRNCSFQNWKRLFGVYGCATVSIYYRPVRTGHLTSNSSLSGTSMGMSSWLSGTLCTCSYWL